MLKKNNRFKDSLKFLSLSAANVNQLRLEITRFLSTRLPERILSKSNIFNIILEIVTDINNLLYFYVEDSLGESNILTAEYETSIRGLAELTGHKPTRVISSRGSVRCNILPELTQETPVIILEETLVRCINNNLTYIVDLPNGNRRIDTSNEEFVLDLIEGTPQNQIFTANGDKFFIAELDDTLPIANYDIQVRVNGELFTKYDSLYDMGKYDSGYIIRNGFSNQVDVVFGDGVNGIKLDEGDTVDITYRTSNGETGNLINVENPRFEIISGVFDLNGNGLDVNQSIEISYLNGFSLGSNGENIERTRLISGYNSRSLVFALPENLRAYLSRFSVISRIDCWTKEDDLLFYLLILPNISGKLSTYQDYLELPESELIISDTVKQEILSAINNSRRQAVSSEILFVQPEFIRYSIFIYLDASYYNQKQFISTIYNTISKFFIDKIFTYNSDPEMIISKSEITDSLYDLDEVNRVSINIFNQENEQAKIDGFYFKEETVTNGSVKEVKQVRYNLNPDENPNLNFTELNDIQTSSRNKIPILRGGWEKYNGENSTFLVERPIYIFIKDVNGNWNDIK